MTLNAYIDALRGSRVAVLGLGVSNLPLLELLLRGGVAVTARDRRDRESFGPEKAAALEERGCTLRLGEDYLAELTEDVIFRTPGLHPFTPELAAARDRGAVLTSEMEAFFTLCPCRIMAVTGSDGKTTTTTVLSELLKAEGFTVHLGGNIGTPLLDRTPEMTPDDWAVLELSSFQLHSMRCAPDVAVITNVSPNHLDVHPDYADYQTAKKQIFLSQGRDGLLVLNADNAVTRGFAAEAPGRVRLFSRREEPENGCFLRDGAIFLARDGRAEKLMDAAEIRIPGLHNVENYMAAFAAAADLVSPESCRRVAREFPGVPHRLEMVRTRRGVAFCNDSIASSPTRTIAGLRALEGRRIHLIAGGYDKRIPFDELGDEVCRRVKALYLTGSTAEKIARAVEESSLYDPAALTVRRPGDFRQTVLAAAAAAEPGELVLLSPACASFDSFKNFAERGDAFRRIVMELEE